MDPTNCFFRCREKSLDPDERASMIEFFEHISKDLSAKSVDYSLLFKKIIQEASHFTKSRFAFLGKTAADGTHTVLAVTNTAWDLSSLDFYIMHRTHPNFHTFLTEIHELKIHNKNRGIYTPMGHPPITRYLVAPIQYRNHSKAYLLLCNKPTKYTAKDAMLTNRLLNMMSYAIYTYKE